MVNRKRNPVAGRVVELWNQGTMTASEIAAQLGTTKNAVIGIVNRARAKGLITRPFDVTKANNAKQVEQTAPIRITIKKPTKSPTPLSAQEQPSLTWKVTPMPKAKTGKYLWDLNDRDCRFPTSRTANHHIFCGEAIRDSRTRYCEHHHKVVWVKQTKPTVEQRKRLAEIKRGQRARRAPVFGSAMG